jgi:uncharacterized protein YecT (DUF1311 family)
MLKIALLPMLCGCVLLVDAPASNSQDSSRNCLDLQTQTEMNICAQEDFQAADKELNTKYKQARDLTRKRDEGSDVELKGADEALVRAQRAWIAYRDAQCDSAAFQSRGGSMQPLVLSSCKANLTRARVKELAVLIEELDR